MLLKFDTQNDEPCIATNFDIKRWNAYETHMKCNQLQNWMLRKEHSLASQGLVAESFNFSEDAKEAFSAEGCRIRDCKISLCRQWLTELFHATRKHKCFFFCAKRVEGWCGRTCQLDAWNKNAWKDCWYATWHSCMPTIASLITLSPGSHDGWSHFGVRCQRTQPKLLLQRPWLLEKSGWRGLKINATLPMCLLIDALSRIF